MQIRIQGKTIQIIRAPYDSTKRRCVPKIVARLPVSSAGNITDDMLSVLTDDERGHVRQWIADRAIARADAVAQTAADGMASTIRHLAHQAGRLTDVQAADVYAAITELTLSLRRAGHTRPKGDPVPPVAQPGQMSLTG